MLPPAAFRVSLFLYLSVLAQTGAAFPDKTSLASLADLRSDDEHPLDLYHPEHLSSASLAQNQLFRLDLNATEFDGTGLEWVTVSWTLAVFPREDDIIALYAYGEDDWLSKAPIKTTYASEAPTHVRSGSGSLPVRLYNHRTDVKFLFIRDFLGSPHISGESPVIKLRRQDYPLYVHLALTDKENEMRVQWVSSSAEPSVVLWGTKSGKLDEEAVATRVTYTPADLCGPPATTQGYIDPGYMHSAVLKGLKPGQLYYYRFGNRKGGLSEEHSFKSPPVVGPETSVKIIGLADMGQYNVDYFDNPNSELPSLGTSKNIHIEKDVDLIFHPGDISYAEGYVAEWDVFFDQLYPLVSKVPYMTIPGNHERLYPNTGDRYDRGHDSGGECGVVYERRLQMPATGVDKPWYSVNFGPIHFLAFSAEHDFEPGTEQFEFMKEDLEAVNHLLTPWVIVCVHRPMYPGITHDSGPRGYWFVGQELQEHLGDLFYENGVDMIWSGHHHSYQRTCPVHKETCVDDGTVQIIFGNAGARLYTNLVKRPFIEFQALQFGYIRAMVNSSQLTVEAVSNVDREVIDTVTLYKDRPTA